MSTATTYRPLIVTELDRDGWDRDGSIAEGEGLEMAATGLYGDQFTGLPAEHPGVLAWERVVDEAVREIAPQVGELLYEALQRRLPWTWEPERSGTAGGLDPIRAEFREAVAQATERAILRAAHDANPEG